MKNKYYVNGKLVRTSENEYTHAIMVRTKCIACCGSLALANKRFNSEYNEIKRDIEWHKKALKEIENGTRQQPKWYESLEKYISALKSDLLRAKNRLESLHITTLEKV